ncbi:NAD(P)-binding protein [Paraburkholderia tagetis]|uniref:NAD(P)-binding protein n=1 Tax=Paraburkholderia tagetis TaxID=2913261 RepID=UPI003B75C83A
MAPANRHILISGAGIAGSALAHQLLRFGFEPTIVEHAAVFRNGGYMIDVVGHGIRYR